MTNHRRLPALDLLRAIAILWVFVHHLGGWMSRSLGLDVPKWAATVLQYGVVGVDLFFVLSGYLIGSILLKEFQKSRTLQIRKFWARRWFRTLPAYYVVLLIIVASDFFLARSQSSTQPWGGFFHYLFFTQNYMTPLLRFGWSWSLCVEEHFYLFLPLLIVGIAKLFPRLSPVQCLRVIALSGIFVSILSRVWVVRSGGLTTLDWNTYITSLYSLTHCRLDGLAVGLLCATLGNRKPHPLLDSSLGILAVTCLIVMMNLEQTSLVMISQYTVLSAIFGIFLILGVTPYRISSITLPGVKFIAENSYSLYLIHPIIIRVAERALGGRYGYLQLIVVFFGSLAGSYALRLAVELPLLNIRDRYYPEKH